MAQKRPLVIYGTSGHALAVQDAAESAGYEVVAFVGEASALVAAVGAPVPSGLNHLSGERTAYGLGIGTNFFREDSLVDILSVVSLPELPPIVHSTAFVSRTAELGFGSVVLAHAYVGPGCEVGVGALLNTASSLDHGSRLGNFASLGPGARTAGNVTVGERTMVGMNSCILEQIEVGSDTVIGANSIVNKELPDKVVAFGSPASAVRMRGTRDPYFKVTR